MGRLVQHGPSTVGKDGSMSQGSVNSSFIIDQENIPKEVDEGESENPLESANLIRQKLLQEEHVEVTEINSESPEEYSSSNRECSSTKEHVFTDKHGHIHRHLLQVSHVNKTGDDNDEEQGAVGGEGQDKWGVPAKTSTSYDTMDNCLHVATQMESILAYHYGTIGNPDAVTTAEIFALDDPIGPNPESWVKDVSLAWDGFADSQKRNGQSLRLGQVSEGSHFTRRDEHKDLLSSNQPKTFQDFDADSAKRNGGSLRRVKASDCGLFTQGDAEDTEIGAENPFSSSQPHGNAFPSNQAGLQGPLLTFRETTTSHTEEELLPVILIGDAANASQGNQSSQDTLSHTDGKLLPLMSGSVDDDANDAEGT